jgi:hypothetical protein
MQEKNLGHFLFKRILDQLAPDIHTSLTSEQLLALTQACDALGTPSHPINLRVVIPLPRRSFYTAFLAGPERRSQNRLARDGQSREAQGTYLVNRILEQVTPAIRKQFTHAQIQALIQACAGIRRKAHAIDLRLSIPLPGRGFYLVVWAGQEQRSRQRSRKSHQAFKVRALMMGGALLGYAVLASLLFAQRLTVVSVSQAPVIPERQTAHPTIIPFKKSQASCETMGRVWRDDQCFDYDHNPVF